MPTTPSPGDLLIEHRMDAELTPHEDQELRHLLMACFPLAAPIFLARRYIRAAPAHRWFARNTQGELAGHVALHDKTIETAAGPLHIGGVAEVCVAHHYRGQGLVKRLLAETHAWMKAQDFPFALLFGQPRVYHSSGYVLITNEIDAENSLAFHWNPFCGKPMIRKIGAREWPEGRIDLRGPTF